MSIEDRITKIITYAISAFLISVCVSAALVLDAWAVSHLWRWFAVPFGVPDIQNYWHALGLGAVIGMLTHQRSQQRPEDEKWWKPFLYLYGRPIITVAFGALFHSQMVAP